MKSGHAQFTAGTILYLARRMLASFLTSRYGMQVPHLRRERNGCSCHSSRRIGLLETVRRLVFWALAAVPFAACSPVLYSPVGQNVPMLRSKGDVDLNLGSCSTSDRDIKGVALQGAVAVSNNLAVIASYYTLHGPRRRDDPLWTGKGNYIEAGAGLYTPTDQPKGLFAELFAGVGYQHMENSRYTSGGWAASDAVAVNFVKPFIQPNLGARGRVVDIAFTPKIAFIDYTSSNQRMQDLADSQKLNTFLREEKVDIVFEPGVTIRAGYEFVKAQFQYCYTSFEYSDGNFDPYVKEFVSFGLNIQIRHPNKK